jgi:hypothetical protein
MKLSQIVTPKARFSRSVNVERDTARSAIEGFLPTGRALDIVRRVARSFLIEGSSRAFSITGPHGSGKSSLALFMEGLTSPGGSPEFVAAFETLKAAESEVADLLKRARERTGAERTGFIQCVVTADREPVSATVARALHHGAVMYFGKKKSNPIPENWSDPQVGSRLTLREIRDQISTLADEAPVLLIIDEFGKNLEAYVDSGRDGDPFLLQELAEMASGDAALPLVVITMQHLAFDEYVNGAASTQRREWVKVQGRFEDIAYIETASQTRGLIASAFNRSPGSLDNEIARWVEVRRSAYYDAGLRDIIDSEAAQNAYPLHPIALAVLPELCSRYGQNERTLFSFLAGPEPLAVPSLLNATDVELGANPFFVRVSDVYDYFVASASTMITSASIGGRWVEIESRIRDTSGLDMMSLKALKTIGVLNLVSAGGALRASKGVLTLALDERGNHEDLNRTLKKLEAKGLVTYREFADEFRIWQGSDFDLKAAVDAGRRKAKSRTLEDILNESAPQAPIVAARHSQQTGTFRIFERRFSSLEEKDLIPSPPESEWDGTVLLALTDGVPKREVQPEDKPIVIGFSELDETLTEVAIDASTLADALVSAEAQNADWVAKRELIERYAISQQRLRDQIEVVFDSQKTTWRLLGSGKQFAGLQSPSRVLSDVADEIYRGTPVVPNEVLARREPTSQGAKARRLLIERMLSCQNLEFLGIEGFPAERAMYDAILARTGLHGRRKDGSVGFKVPTDDKFVAVWRVIEESLLISTDERIQILDVWRKLQRPPFGLKDGPIPVLLIAALIQLQDDLAIYEHGSLVLSFDDAVAERFVKNPSHFTVRNTAVTSSVRLKVVRQLADELQLGLSGNDMTLLGLARSLFGQLQRLEPYALGTRTVSGPTERMRRAFRTATEPDQLIFHELPKVFDLQPIKIGRKIDNESISRFVSSVTSAIKELESAYPRLLSTVRSEISTAFLLPPDHLRETLSAHSRVLADSVLDSRLKALVNAACRDDLNEKEWTENIAMVIADAQAPRSWSDETVERFRLAATEVGGSFRRVSALLSERRAIDSSEINAVPIAVTRIDGREAREVLWVTEEEREAASEMIESMMIGLRSVFGTAERVREVVLASLLDAKTTSQSDDSISATNKPQPRGKRHA